MYCAPQYRTRLAPRRPSCYVCRQPPGVIREISDKYSSDLLPGPPKEFVDPLSTMTSRSNQPAGLSFLLDNTLAHRLSYVLQPNSFHFPTDFSKDRTESYNLLNVMEALLLADKIVINTFESGSVTQQTHNIINTLNSSSRSLFHLRSPEIRHAKGIAGKVARELRRYAPSSDFLAGIEAPLGRPLGSDPILIKNFYGELLKGRSGSIRLTYQNRCDNARSHCER